VHPFLPHCPYFCICDMPQLVISWLVDALTTGQRFHISTIFSHLLFLPLWINVSTIKPKVRGLNGINYAAFCTRCAILDVASLWLATSFKCNPLPWHLH
jgi:hypothetical protein